MCWCTIYFHDLCIHCLRDDVVLYDLHYSFLNLARYQRRFAEYIYVLDFTHCLKVFHVLHIFIESGREGVL